MATPPSTDPATQAFSAGSSELSAIKRLAASVRLPHARRHRSTARRVVLAVLAGLAALVLLLLADGVWAGRSMFLGVSSARSALTEGSIAIVTGDPGASILHFERAAGAADSAISAGDHPSIVLARRIPWLGDNLDAVRAVAEASRRSADAGLSMAEAARILGWQDLRIPVEAIGDVDLPTIERATPAIDEVAATLGIAFARLEAADTGRLVGPVAAGYEDSLEMLRRRAKIALDTRVLVELLPRFLGGGAQRQYLLAVQTLGRPQGTGGEVDLIGVLTADDGVLALDAPLAPADDAFAEATATTDARAAGEDLLAAARVAGLGELDGVMLADSLWLAGALWATGSVDVSERRLPVNGDEAAEVLEREVFEYADTGSAAARRAEVATTIVESYLAGRPATETFAVTLARDIDERHLVIVASRPRERRALERLGAGGVPEVTAQQLVSVTWNTEVENHAAVFTRRDVSHRVMLQEDGSARIRTVVTLVNGAPEGPPSALLGFPLPATVAEPADVNPVGGWAADVDVTLPPKADRITAETSIPSETDTVKDDGRTTVIGRLATDPGDSMSLIVGYRVVDAKIDDGVYRLLVLPQPSWPPGPIRIHIAAPPGAVIAEASEQLVVGGTSADYSGTPSQPFSLWIRYT